MEIPTTIWRFPGMGVPPNHPNFSGIFPNINHPAIGVAPLMEQSTGQKPDSWDHPQVLTMTANQKCIVPLVFISSHISK